MSWFPPTSPVLSFIKSSKILSAAVISVIIFAVASGVRAQALEESFDSLSFILSTGGWTTVNHSDPLNFSVNGWSQCTGAQIPPSQSGSPNSCVLASFNSVAPDQSGVISNWLISPVRTIKNGDMVSFYTRTRTANPFGDRLQFRLSTSGNSADIGVQASEVGDFTTLLLDISPTYTVGEYPETWTKYTVRITGLTAPASGRFGFRYFVENGGALGTHGYTVGVDSFVYTPLPANSFDYDGDGRSDFSVFRPSNGAWYLQQSTAGFFGVSFGDATDKIAPADYDGDRKIDVAVYRPSTGIWYISNSSDGTVSYYGFGSAEDLPVPADYDGDNKADIAVFRPSNGTWYRQNSSNGAFVAYQFGTSGDKPTIGDFDGDSKSDFAIFRPSTGAWYQVYSSNGFNFGEQFGIGTDEIAPADYDGDGKTDIAIYRPSESLWYVKNSATETYTPFVFGLPTDIPTPGDFEGDGKADIAVFRPSDGTWYVVKSFDGQFIINQFGQNGDRPTHGAFNGHQ